MPEAVFSVSRLNGYIKKLLENDVMLEYLFVQGELSNFKDHVSGHWYFTLKDENAAINCVMFRNAAREVPFLPHDGLKVIVSGRVSLYEKTGAYQVYADQMSPLGKGSLALAFEQLKAKLGEEGLFDASHKRSIPGFPRTVAVITSPVGAAVRDIIQIARSRNPKVGVVVIPALMQGEGAAASIEAAFGVANAWGRADVVILARGGGSQEDLRPFNEERVARAIYASNAPVVSAVGHETDYTISDFTADMRAPTPSAAAEMAVPLYDDLKNMLLSAQMALSRSASRCLENKRNMLNAQIKRDLRWRALKSAADLRMGVGRLSTRLDRAACLRVDMEKGRVGAVSRQLENLSPMGVMSRGYAVVAGAGGRRVASAGGLGVGDRIQITFVDGSRPAVVTGDVYAKEKADV